VLRKSSITFSWANLRIAELNCIYVFMSRCGRLADPAKQPMDNEHLRRQASWPSRIVFDAGSAKRPAAPEEEPPNRRKKPPVDEPPSREPEISDPRNPPPAGDPPPKRPPKKLSATGMLVRPVGLVADAFSQQLEP
jgi:hypothetical protein